MDRRRVSGAEQGHSLSKARVKHDERGHQMNGDRYVLGFAPALRFLRSQILCRLYKSPLGERCPVYIRMQKHHIGTLKVLSPCPSSVDYVNTKITQHALKLSESS